MAHIVIFPGPPHASYEGGDMNFYCKARLSSTYRDGKPVPGRKMVDADPTIEFEAVVPMGVSAATMNEAIKAAAVAAAAAAGFTVENDEATIFGGAVGL